MEDEETVQGGPIEVKVGRSWFEATKIVLELGSWMDAEVD